MDLLAFGKLHASKQQYDCSVEDLNGLLQLTAGKPFRNWTDDLASISVEDVTAWFPRDHDRIAIYGGDDRQGVSYAQLHEMLGNCPEYHRVSTVALLLPLDLRAETAVALVSLLSKPLVTVAPLDYMMPLQKMVEAFQQMKCNAIVTTRELYEKLMDQHEVVIQKMSDIRLIVPSERSWSLFQWNILRSSRDGNKDDTISIKDIKKSLPSNHPRMLVRTSGSTAQPKVVPLPASQMIHAAAGLAYGLRLSSDDVCICTMPLFHTGGIAGALLCVLVSGSSVVMMKGSFDAEVFLQRLDPVEWESSAPTWACLVPTMIKTLTLTAQSLFDALEVKNRLRMIRSTTAHLPHESALDFSRLFHASVYPTMGMSECLPITIPDPISWDFHQTNQNTVGLPAACSIHIVDENGDPIPYGQLGEISVGGPGAIQSYVGIPRERSHTARGLLRTGDIGYLDKDGHLFIKGRSKEMIKRGGEQVWPSEIDYLIGNIEGVEMAVAFSVPNELWGEEVAVAVILQSSVAKQNSTSMRSLILEVCQNQLDHFAVPKQIIFLDSKNELPRAGLKVLRSKMASTLGVQSVDTGALRVLKAGQSGAATASSSGAPSSDSKASPSKALNGVRAFATYCVVMTHVGWFESKAMVKLQSFSLNMPIFFFLLPFQMACEIQPNILKRWGSFVGSKIGSMHAFFVIAQFLGTPSYLIWKAPSGVSLGSHLADIAMTTLSANALLRPELVYKGNAFGPVWFLTLAYQFIIVFPLLNARLQERTTTELIHLLAVSTAASVVLPGVLFELLDMDLLQFQIWSWVPHLVASAVAGNLFRRLGPMERGTESSGRFGFLQNADFWGNVSDVLSLLLLILVVVVGWFSSDNLYVSLDTYEDMRPDEDYEDYEEDIVQLQPRDKLVSVVWAYDVTMDEFDNFVRDDEESEVSVGRWENDIIYYTWVFRLGSPVAMLWLYGIAFGQCLTARVMKNKILQELAKLGYGIYMLHIPIAKYYWLLTRGLAPQEFWKHNAEFPLPVEYYEFCFILVFSGFAAHILDSYAVPYVVPYTVKAWTFAMHLIEWWWNPSVFNKIETDNSVLGRVKNIVEGITGVEVSSSTKLDSMGLDSLGASAFLGLLRQQVPSTKTLSVSQVTTQFDTVGDLVSFLSGDNNLLQKTKVKTQ